MSYALFAVAAAYQLLAIFACLRFVLLRRPSSGDREFPAVSVLKPVHGLHPGLREALASHLRQDYPQFELLVGHRDPDDASVAVLDELGVRHYVCPTVSANAKAGVLRDLACQAHFGVLVVNDADIVAPPGYLTAVTAPLADPKTGVVTCLYRAEGDSWPARFEALGVATEFAPSALVAPLMGVSEFGFGSTLAFRREDLEAIGGFESLADYLADDYQLGARIHRLGRRNVISDVVVSTRLHAATWSEVWRHQVRWARTIRLSRAGGYAGLPVTFATLWAIVLGALGWWWLGAALLGLRLVTAVAGGWMVVRSMEVWKLFLLIPARDLFGVAVWAAGLAGSTVEWGGRLLRLDKHGRIIGLSSGPRNL